MDSVLYFVKIVVLAQMTLILFIIILLYLDKLFFKYKDKWESRERARITKLMNRYATNNRDIPQPIIGDFNTSIFNVLLHFAILENKYEGRSTFSRFKSQLSAEVLKPVAREGAFSNDWFKRYIATLCYLYGIDSSDEEIVLKLIEDESLLISVNAAKVATKFYTPKLINAIISVYSKASRVRQAVYAGIIVKGSPDISAIIINRLKTEKESHVKEFCYRLLARLPKKNQPRFSVKQDLKSDSLDLKIVALKYLSRLEKGLDNEVVYFLSDAAEWELRAILAKELGHSDIEESITILEKLLNDKVGWVQVNAAYSLLKKGERGIAILKKQSPERNKLAYETAQEVLKQI